MIFPNGSRGSYPSATILSNYNHKPYKTIFKDTFCDKNNKKSLKDLRVGDKIEKRMTVTTSKRFSIAPIFVSQTMNKLNEKIKIN